MLPEEVTKFIGQGGNITVLEVEKGAIIRFADAVDDPNPLYGDEEHARKSRYGSIIAPPGFFGWSVKRAGSLGSFEMGELTTALAKAGYTGAASIDAGIEYEFFTPIRAGDKLVSITRIKDIYEREGKTGKMAFVIRETTYTNQNGDLVAKARQTAMRR